MIMAKHFTRSASVMLALLILGAGGISGHAQTKTTVSTPPPSRLRILFAQAPALLVRIDGRPVYRPIAGTDLERLVNTTALIVRESAGVHYLKVAGGWMQAYTLSGYWSASGVPPGATEALHGAADAAAAAELVAADSIAQARQFEQRPPAVFISFEPAALIVTDGPARYQAIEGTSLEYLVNTAAEVFREPTDQELYVRIEEQWYRSWRTDGPWDFVSTADLPTDIAAYGRTRARR
jgi:hypothetical protein